MTSSGSPASPVNAVSTPPQDYTTHRRLNPLHHYVATPLILGWLGYAGVGFVRGPSVEGGFQVALGLGLLALAVSTRLMALTVQDRVIRLEMQLRLAAVLPAELAARAATLDRRHLIALRFASDEELPELVERALAGELASGDAIKRAIQVWQPDHLRA